MKENITRNFFSGYALIAGGIWEEDILITDIEELGNFGCIRNIYPRRLSAKEVLINTKRQKNLYLLQQMVSAKLSGRDYEFQEPTLRRESTVRRENLSGESQGDGEEFQLEETKDDAEPRKDFWSDSGRFHLSSSY